MDENEITTPGMGDTDAVEETPSEEAPMAPMMPEEESEEEEDTMS